MTHSLTHSLTHSPIGISHIIHEQGRAKDKVGTRGSLLTSNILDSMPVSVKTKGQIIAEKFISVFQSPHEHLSYLQVLTHTRTYSLTHALTHSSEH
jgi:hypothetical protein